MEDRKSFSFPSMTNGDSPSSFLLESKEPVRIVQHNCNTGQKLMTVTEDKVLICLNRNLKRVGRKGWIHPFSLLMTLLLALATSEFNKLTWISPNLLKALFIVTSCSMTGWLIWEIMHSGKMKSLTNVINDIFDELKGSREEESAGARLDIDPKPLTWLPMRWRQES